MLTNEDTLCPIIKVSEVEYTRLATFFQSNFLKFIIMCSYSLPMANHMLQKRNHTTEGTDSRGVFFSLLCHLIKRHACTRQRFKKVHKQYYEKDHHYKEISRICPGTDVSTSIITATLTNLIPFSVDSINFQ